MTDSERCPLCAGKGRCKPVGDALARPPKEDAEYQRFLAEQNEQRCPLCGGRGYVPPKPKYAAEGHDTGGKHG